MTDTPPPPPPPATPDPAGGTRPDRPWWKRKRVLIPAVVVALIVIAGIAGGGEDEPEPATSDATATTAEDTGDGDGDGGEATATSEPEPTTTTAPPATGVGAVLDTGSGGLARLNAVTPNAPPANEFISPTPGATFTRLDVEVCAGDDGQEANPLYWVGALDDNADATAALGAQSYQTVSMAPGECQRGTIDLEVPDGRTVTGVYLTSPGLSEIARWHLDEPSTEVTGPLTPTDPPERSPIAQVVDTANGTAVVHGVTDAAPPANEFVTPAPGTTFTRLDVEVCAGDEPLETNPLYWYGLTAQHRWLAAELGAQNFETGQIAAGQCRRGTVDVAVADGDQVTAVALVDPGLGQVAAWSR